MASRRDDVMTYNWQCPRPNDASNVRRFGCAAICVSPRRCFRNA